jgi:hypothetical protein
LAFVRPIEDKNKQLQKQIPCGDDNQKNKGKGKGKYGFFVSLR